MYAKIAFFKLEWIFDDVVSLRYEDDLLERKFERQRSGQ